MPKPDQNDLAGPDAGPGLTAGAHPAVDRFLDAVVTAGIPSCAAFADDAVLDATIPEWRFTARGRRAIEETFSEWYADEGQFDHLERIPVSDGEIVEFTLRWIEHDVLHICHQLHRIRIGTDGLIAQDTAWCGGRWPEELLAEMAAAGGDV